MNNKKQTNKEPYVLKNLSYEEIYKRIKEIGEEIEEIEKRLEKLKWY